LYVPTACSPLSLHVALPIWELPVSVIGVSVIGVSSWSAIAGIERGRLRRPLVEREGGVLRPQASADARHRRAVLGVTQTAEARRDWKSTRLNSRHQIISYAV